MLHFRILSTCLAIATLTACGLTATRSALPTVVQPYDHQTGDATRTKSTYKQLHSFGSGADGANPAAPFLNVNGTLYGTTEEGGAYGAGVVFSMTPVGVEHVLHSFGKGVDGASPVGGLVELNGTLFGTTIGGGRFHNHTPGGNGTVFSITTAGKERVLYNFGKGKDASNPAASLIAVNGTLYGTTLGGGLNTWGTVFSITPAGKERVLHSFGGSDDGRSPLSPLVALGSTLYGTTEYGTYQSGDAGAVFSITLKGTEKLLYTFGRTRYDGAAPFSGLTVANGMLYGTTMWGGAQSSGTVYRITTDGKEKVLYSFLLADSNDGRNPVGGLTRVKNILYGTTLCGGSASVDCRGSFKRAPGGTIFSITLKGKETVLYSFGHKPTDGAQPQATLLLTNGVLYGTTYYGGASGRSGMGSGSAFLYAP